MFDIVWYQRNRVGNCEVNGKSTRDRWDVPSGAIRDPSRRECWALPTFKKVLAVVGDRSEESMDSEYIECGLLLYRGLTTNKLKRMTDRYSNYLKGLEGMPPQLAMLFIGRSSKINKGETVQINELLADWEYFLQ